jgi:hypothetical protein
MDEITIQKLKKFEDIYGVLSKEYKWSSTQLINSFTSLIYTISDADFNLSQFDEMQRYIKENTGIFSHYRGYDKFFTPALLATKFEAPKEMFLKLVDTEEKLHHEGFTKGTYAGLAAYALLTSCPHEDIDRIVKKTKVIYDKMKEKHFWLTGQDDYPLAVLLSLSEEDTLSLMDRIENLYHALNANGFAKSNNLQLLSHILSFSSDDVDTKVRKCVEIVNYFKEKKIKTYTNSYATIGLIALMFNECDDMLFEIFETYEYVKGLKGFKWLEKDILLLIASGIVTNKNIDSYKQNASLVETSFGISVQAIIAAQTAAVIAATSSAAAAAAASSSS